MHSILSFIVRHWPTIIAVLLGWMLPPLPQLRAADIKGETVFQTKCAVCHGAHGEGTKKTKQRLEGERTVSQLVEVIKKTMPEDNPGTLSNDESLAVADYIHGEFYSPIGREKNRPARIELARLTVRQYRQVLADLIGPQRDPQKWDDKRGLRGEYYKGKNLNQGNRVAERTDPQVKFDFGVEAPIKDKMDATDFAMRWSGSLIIPETGDYEFVVHTEHSAKLWVNETNRPSIDAWVKSGNETDYKVNLFLLAGRVYPLRLEFFKAKHGEKDPKNKDKEEKKPPPTPASITLSWKRPNGVLESIPTENLSPSSSQESYVCGTSFPPDDRSYGWERGTSVSKEWDQATTEAALTAMDFILPKLPQITGVKDDSPDREKKLKEFCRTFIERAFRRPLSKEQGEALIDKPFAAASDLNIAVKRVLLLTLKSPRFLYREIGAQPDNYDVASRLSFALWDSLPSPELLKAAASDQLKTKEQIAKQAERMLADPRAKAKGREFLLTWLKVDQARDLTKDATTFPDFDPAMIADLRISLELFLDQVLSSDRSDFRELLLAEEIPLNERLAKFYGLDAPEQPGFTKMKLNADQRAGVLTHPYLMTSYAHNTDSSPILRGVYLARGILGLSLRPPPEAIAPLPADLHPDLSTRERVAIQTKATACMTCHGIINPLGYTFEHFDAVGRFRELDHGKAVDSTGSYRTSGGREVTLNNAKELAKFLVDSDEAQSAFVEQLFHHLVQQPVRAYGPDTLEELRKSFIKNEFNIRKLAIEIMTVSVQQKRETVAQANGK